MVDRGLQSLPPYQIADYQFTRGLDVSLIEIIHKQIIHGRDQGAAVLLISAEMNETSKLELGPLISGSEPVMATGESCVLTRSLVNPRKNLKYHVLANGVSQSVAISSEWLIKFLKNLDSPLYFIEKSNMNQPELKL